MNIRKMLASFAAVALLMTTMGINTAIAGTFEDVPEDHWAYDYVETLVADGVIDEGTNYRPDDNLNRAELVKIAIEATGIELDSSGGPSFDDVAEDAWYYDYVETAALNGIVEGYADEDGSLTGMFGPGDTVNRAQATKILVNAFAVPAKDAGPTFSDVESGTWYYEYVETAYAWTIVDGYDDGTFGPGDPVTRAQIAKITVNSASPVERVVEEEEVTEEEEEVTEEEEEVTEEEEEVTVSAAGLTVAMGTVIAAASIPDGATAIKYLNVDLTAGAEDDVEIDALAFHRFGLGSYQDFSAVYLYEGAERLTSGRSISSDTNMVEFNNINVTVAAGATVTLTVKGDMDLTNGDSGDENAFELMSADDVDSNAAEVTFSGSIVGNTMTISGAQAGSVIITANGTVPNPTVGESQAKVAEFKLEAGTTEDIEVEEIRLVVKGTISTSDISNFKLYQGTDLLAEDAELNKDDIMTFTLDPVFEIERGDTRIFYVYADIGAKATASETIQIYVEEDTDLLAIGQVYGYGVRVTRSSYDGGSTSEMSSSSIQGGQITIGFVGPTATDVQINSKDVTFLEVTFASERNIEVQRLAVSIGATLSASNDCLMYSGTSCSTTSGATNTFTDVKIKDKDSGSTLMGPSEYTYSGSGANSITFTDKWTMNAGETKTLIVTMDVANATALNNATASISLGTISTSNGIKDLDSGNYISDIVPQAAIDGNIMTIRTSSLVVALASSPASSSVVKNTSDVSSVGFIFTAGQASDVTVTDLVFTGYFDENGDGTYGSSGSDNSKNLYSTVGSGRLYDEDGNQVGKAENVSTTNGKITFDGLNWTVQSGETAQLTLKVGVLSSSVPQSGDNDLFSFDIATAASDITAQDEDGNSVEATGNAANGGGSPNVVITVSSAGTLYLRGSADQEKDDNIVAGISNILVAKYEAYSATETFTIEDLTLQLDSTAATEAVSSMIIKYPSKDDADSTLEKTGSRSGTRYTFNDVNIYVPKDEANAITIEVYVSTNPISSGYGTGSFDKISVDIDTSSSSSFKALGDGSQNTIDFGGTNTAPTTSSVTGNDFYVYRSVPTVATDSNLIKVTTLPTGAQDVYGFTVSADSKGDIGLYKISFEVGQNNLTIESAGTWNLYEVDSSGNHEGSSIGTGTYTAGTVAITLSSEVTIGKGSKKYFVLESPASDGISVGGTAQFADLSVKIASDTTEPSALTTTIGSSGSFVWSDKTGSNHGITSSNSADWTTGYKVDNLPTTSITLSSS